MSQTDILAVKSDMSPQKQHQPVNSIPRDECWIGAYVLLVDVLADCYLLAGRYNSGRPIQLHQGHYLYAGSAMGGANGLYLPKRLLRHARRSGELPNHRLYSELEAHFVAGGIGEKRLHTKTAKKLHWNIDYLMDHEMAELESVVYLRSNERLEFEVVEQLESDGTLLTPYPGFGAHDHPGHSHLFAATDAFRWREFVAMLASRFERR